ncbi:hypothetical protein Asp14428_12550 [Actinoplanes sp. NBRC 14428]|uniref:CBS domain protein n=1 Tax=Pseudosporangium ferrugineum TaxID=439699 RepID=A0A2T0SEZ6_9ACTN|nr:CBS domain-containing protein [Pseudosporangium ferrugineum]PRY31980.1 CBS domain protein [Pseudosporangium ferrugineum]BCJ49780.1 hypothetical protein Asp14428_12550 [Actinoplanes sp. NBRC 14428]
MRQGKVRDVMTGEVLTIAGDATPTEVVTLMTAYDVSALAVVDEFDVVLGVVTRTDVLRALRHRPAAPGLTWRRTTARRMMSAPALTVAPGATPAEAAAAMTGAGVKRLLVVDHRRRMLGIVAATDLLKVFARENVTAGAPAPEAATPAAEPTPAPSGPRRPSLDAWWIGRRHRRTDTTGVRSAG